MKYAKVFGIVVAAHVVVIGALLMQPGCQSSKKENAEIPVADTAGEEISTLDPSYNSGYSEPVRNAPTRPTGSGASYSGYDAYNATEPFSAPVDPVAAPVAAGETYKVVKGDTLSKIASNKGVTLDALLEANDLTRSSVLQIGQELVIPVSDRQVNRETSTAMAGAVLANAAPLPSESAEYTVVSGDALSKIARKFNITVAALKAANGLTSDSIRVGQKLVIPGGSASGAATVSSASKPAAAPVATSGVTYEVKAGDTLGKIAGSYKVSVDALMKANNITDPRKLRVGQKLTIPGATATASAPAPRPAPAATPAASTPVPAPSADPTQSDPSLSELEKLMLAEPLDEVPVVPVDETPVEDAP